jgi:DNA-binding GntR family transcriptional regulator
MSEQPTSDVVRGKHPTEDLIYDRLVEAITDKHLRPSEHLNEVKLAEAYNVPRSRVRRVLERLRDEHVVVFELNRGAFISRPTPADARDVFEARRHLECTVVRLACERADEADIADLRRHLAHEWEAFHDRKASVNRTAGEFHFMVARIARNPVLEKMLGVLIRRCVLVQSVYEKKVGVLCLTHEHGHIVDLIASRRADDAVAEMNLHFDHITSSLDLSEKQHGSADIYQLSRS